MNFILTPEDYITTDWSGGTTNELFIYPVRASFKAQDFDIRLSTASVDLEETTFTSLPGVDRTLMVLKGTLELNHNKKQTVNLNEFDVDSFKGGGITTAKGKCKDFNLMLRNGLEGDISMIKFDREEHQIYGFKDLGQFNFVYLLEGALTVETEKGDFNLNQKELLVLESIRMIKFSSINPARLILVRVGEVEEDSE